MTLLRKKKYVERAPFNPFITKLVVVTSGGSSLGRDRRVPAAQKTGQTLSLLVPVRRCNSTDVLLVRHTWLREACLMHESQRAKETAVLLLRLGKRC
jgi:hypothetical protein